MVRSGAEWARGDDAMDDAASFEAVREGARLGAGFADAIYALRLEPDPGFEYVSPSMTDVIGYTPDEHYADPELGLRLVDPRDRASLATAASAPEGEVVAFTVRWIARDGRRVWTSHRCRVRTREDGSRALYGAVRDVSSEHLAESLIASGLDELPTASVMVFDSDLRFLLVRGGALSDNGLSAARLEGMPAAEALEPGRWEFYRPMYEAALAGTTSDVEISSPDGRRRYVVRVAPVRAGDGTVVGGVSVATDVTEKLEMLERVEASEHRFRLLAENSSDFVLLTSPDGVIEWVSPSVTAVLGWRPDEIIGTIAAGLAHPDESSEVSGISRRLNLGEAATGRSRVRCANGEYRWLQRTLRPLRDDAGRVVGRVSGWHDVQAQVEAEQALVRSERRFRLAMESAPIGMAVVDLDRHFVEVNHALCRMLGRDADWLLAHRVPDVLRPGEDALDLRLRQEVLAGKAPARREAELLRADGSTMWAQHSVGALYDDGGSPLSYVSQFADITEARRAREELRFLATHDAMTSLANRKELLDQMNRVLSHPPRTGTRLGVLFFDLDGLKTLNDTLGHALGDTVIVETARRIKASVRGGDIVARLGGDEFIVLLPALRSVGDATTIAAAVLEAIGRPLEHEGREVTVGASAGVALAGPGDSPDRVLARADLALYRAKRTNRGGWLVWEQDVDGDAEG